MPFEIDFLRVGTGNADAICIRYTVPGGYFVHVVDGGYTGTADTILDHIDRYYGRGWYVNNMIVTHADNDHAAGLVGVMESRRVDALYMNRPWKWVDMCIHFFHRNYTRDGLVKRMRDAHEHLVKLEEMATRRGIPILDAFQGTRIGPFTVVAPDILRYVALIPDMDKTPTNYFEGVSPIVKAFLEGMEARIDEWWDFETLSNNPAPVSASNESSIVQVAEIDGEVILLTGDAGPIALNEAVDYIQANGLWRRYPNLIQVPHHGSRKNVTPTILDRLLGSKMKTQGATYGYAVCSVGSGQDDYPRGQVQNAFERRGYPVYATRDGAICYRSGFPMRKGWSISLKEPWAAKVKV